MCFTANEKGENTGIILNTYVNANRIGWLHEKMNYNFVTVTVMHCWVCIPGLSPSGSGHAALIWTVPQARRYRLPEKVPEVPLQNPVLLSYIIEQVSQTKPAHFFPPKVCVS